MSRTVASFAAKASGRGGEYAAQLFLPTSAHVTVDGKRLAETEHGAIHVGAFDISLGGVFRVFPLAREGGVLHIQAGAITPIEMIRALPSLVRGGAIPSKRMLDASGYEMQVEACGDEPLNPIIDGEQFRDLKSLDVSVGPKIRVAVVDGRT